MQNAAKQQSFSLLIYTIIHQKNEISKIIPNKIKVVCAVCIKGIRESPNTQILKLLCGSKLGKQSP